ncbi:dTDP-4-dehydrorhamnose 3,5-epimerase family protein [Succinivibrio dextrinosolvens]|uniref:dTDP-4-dehydrorhamnose 3,5-epimerase family protein n=1 Tax=Succinivibrio dextrinosolvens TaxID=83771 RepID=UPI0004E210E8|nr:dTDP-4-dehydrorhamnose 3,5-epimerase family protein [Succinivibrio dextrinosolvens]
MIIVEKTLLDGVYLVKPSVHEDSRGNFYETYNKKEYVNAGLCTDFVQDDISKSYKGVLKGMHGDSGTFKLVQCVYGSVYAVILNCDENSVNFGKWQSFILSDENRYQLYIPPMYGNGYYVLSDVAVYSYKQSTYYGDYNQFTYKYNDSRFKIKWPADASIISERDS